VTDYNTKFNNDVRTWATTATNDLLTQFDVLNIRHVKRSPSAIPSKDALKNFLKARQGLVDTISFKFPQHMVFVHKGVSKGHPITNPRQAKEWFNPSMDKSVEQLADIVADNDGELIVNNFTIR